MTLFSEPTLERRIFGDFRARIDLTADPPMPDGKDGGIVPKPPQMFKTEDLARRWLLEGLHELTTIHSFNVKLYGTDYGTDVDKVLAGLVVQEFDDAILLGRLNAGGKKEFYEKLTPGGVPYFGAREKAARFNGYNDPEMARVKALTTFETFPEEA
jgi:hypothetical protein